MDDLITPREKRKQWTPRQRSLLSRAMALLGQQRSQRKAEAAIRNVNKRWAAVRAARENNQEAMRQAIAMATKGGAK